MKNAVVAVATPTSPGFRANGFEIFADCSRWCARRMDGLVEGIFVSREDAVRFVRRETDWHTVSSEDEAFYLRIAAEGQYRYPGADLGILVTADKKAILFVAPGFGIYSLPVP